MILDRECIDAGIDANIANKAIRTLDEVRYLVTGSLAETTCGICHHVLRSCPGRAAIFGVRALRGKCPNPSA